MAKEKNGSKWIALTRLAIAVLIAAATILIYFVRTEVKAVGPKIEAVDTKAGSNKEAIKGSFQAIKLVKEEIVADVDDLELEGCKPAKKAIFDAALVQKDISQIQKDVSNLQTGMTDIKDSQQEILRRLPDK